ncbi:MAG: hypothetical protein SF172_05655 [Burkholderiales bacterium]|nr:hypothetical protein [Burkholderiales bacterium]
MSIDERSKKVVAAFQRYVREHDESLISTFSNEELVRTIQQLGWRDKSAGFRLAIENRINQLKEDESKREEGKVRAWNIFTGLLVAVVAGAILLVLSKQL